MSKREAKIEWVGPRPLDNGELEEIVRDDMRKAGVDMRKPKYLISSTVLLTDSLHGPSVSVWGGRGSKKFHAQYNSKTIWVTLKDEGGAA